MILELLGTKYAGIALDLALFGSLASALWAAIKVRYEDRAGHAFPKNKVTIAIDVITDLLPNLPGALHTVAKANGARLFLPQPPAEQPSEDK